MANTTHTGTEDKALIFEVKGNSLDDGPGIRTVIFFKGCPLDCVWCHNPESKKKTIELSFDSGECILCEACRKACPEGALDRHNPLYIDRDRCSLCMNCVDECPSGALSQVGRYWETAELMHEIERDIPFFRTSGGGITLSGGEPTLYMGFISELLKELKSRGISTLIETCGLFDLQVFLEALYPWLDIIYFDLKLFDDARHRTFCGASNRRILENFTHLSARCRQDSVELLPRIPLVPGITSTDDNLASIARFLKDLDMHEVELLPYNPLWFDKCEKIGGSSGFSTNESMKTWMPSEQTGHCRDFFAGFDIR